MTSFASAGSVLGSRYVLDHLIAVGGMGQVWKATDPILERAVAVKLLRTDLIDSDDFRRRFRAEARLAAGLSHPAIADVYDYAEDVADGQRVAFLVMELVDGEPLAERLRRGPVTIAETVSILNQTGRALGAAHSVGIVHRDVKPGNLLITPDLHVKVTDFGIARQLIDSADITEVGQVIGTVRYMSPEQTRGEEATPASDVYSLAIIGYEMLSGHTPFEGASPVAIALAQVQSTPPPLPTSVPAELRSLITRSLAKVPAQRPRDGTVFAAALERVEVGSASSTIRPAASTDVDRSPRPARSPDMQATAVFQHPTTTIAPRSDVDAVVAETTTVGPSESNEPLLAEGWVRQQRRRRRVAVWGAVLAVAACLVMLIAFDRSADPNPSTDASATSVITATTLLPPPTLVTIDPAAYLGHTEADARAALTAAGFTALTTTTGPSDPSGAGLVIDIQPNGPTALDSNVTITLGDGTITNATDPPATDAGPGHGKGKGKGKDKGND